MRNSSYNYRNHQTGVSPFFKWGILIVGLLSLIFWMTSLKSDDTSSSDRFLSATLGSGAKSSIVSLKGKKRTLESGEKFYRDGSTILVENGVVSLENANISLFLEKGEVAYNSGSKQEDVFSFIRGRSWIEVKSGSTLKMKNIDIHLEDGDVVLVEQQSVYSVLYALRGNIGLSSPSRTFTLPAGRRIMVSLSDLSNASTTLESLAGDIDESIRQNQFFLAHGGDTLMNQLKSQSQTGSTSSGNLILGGSGKLSEKYIEITRPTDGSVVSTDTVFIDGKVLSPAVKKVTINGKEATVSPVNETFTLQNFPLSSETTDLVYRAYDAGGNMLERSVITLYSKSKTLGSTEKLVPTTPLNNDKRFRLTSPLENPYRTTDSSVTVSGVVPKDTVEYITVNNFRLKKFVPRSTSWYYYANIGYDTMKEGFNYYEIRFYDANGTLLATQPFTIMKESSRTLSGE